MDDVDFFSMLYAGWAKTTGAENSYWEPEEVEGYGYTIWSVDEKCRSEIGGFLDEADAAFITAVHGCFADLVRRLHEAVDLQEQKDVERDAVMGDWAKTLVLAEKQRCEIEELQKINQDQEFRLSEWLGESAVALSEKDATIEGLGLRIRELEEELCTRS